MRIFFKYRMIKKHKRKEKETQKKTLTSLYENVNNSVVKRALKFTVVFNWLTLNINNRYLHTPESLAVSSQQINPKQYRTVRQLRVATHWAHPWGSWRGWVGWAGDVMRQNYPCELYWNAPGRKYSVAHSLSLFINIKKILSWTLYCDF